MSDLSARSRAILRWSLHLLFTSYGCWTSSRNCWGRSTLRRRNSHAERMEVNMLCDRSLFVWAVPRDAVGERESPSSPQRQMAHHIPCGVIPWGCISPHVGHPLTPSKHHSVNPEVLIHVSSYYREITTISGWVVKPGCLPKSCGRSLRHGSHCLPHSRQESQLDRGDMCDQEPELVTVVVGLAISMLLAQRSSLHAVKEPAA